jgi:hypothetical protein
MIGSERKICVHILCGLRRRQYMPVTGSCQEVNLVVLGQSSRVRFKQS